MTAILIAFRDFILAAALGWVGVSFEPTPRAPAPTAEKSCSAGGACDARRPSFNADSCTAH